MASFASDSCDLNDVASYFDANTVAPYLVAVKKCIILLKF
jgi:hypothetical protein